MDAQVVAAHGDDVVVLWHQRGRTTQGDILDEEVLGLYHFRQGKLARAQMYYFDTAPVAKFLERAKHASENGF
jgi:ketosteroid isomerase-like protein